jgi:hypothetical protein
MPPKAVADDDDNDEEITEETSKDSAKYELSHKQKSWGRVDV